MAPQLPFPVKGRGPHGALRPLSPLLLFLVFTQLSTFNPQPLQAANFTTNALFTSADAAFDGQDIVVSGATLTVDGRHYCPCS